MKRFKKFISLEVGIEMKACLYFAIILFYYFLYQLIQGSLYASIVLMVEMVLAAYAMSYFQVFFLKNFDEAERFDRKVIVSSFFCAFVYTTVSYYLNWYDRNIIATFFFFLYMILFYVCVFLIYKIKRDTDTARLNQELEDFKNRK